MTTRNFNFLLWFSAIVLILACAPSLGTTVPTVDPNQINVFIMQTANAAATQTVAARPTSTPTETPTATPRNTSTVTPTSTSTVIFILASPTSPVTATFTLESSGTSSDNYACQIVSVTPPNGTSFNPRADFDAVWRVKNIGKKNWDHNIIDYTYDSGAKIHKTDAYDLDKDVKRGASTNIAVDMRAPKTAGSYTTHWALRASNDEFCKMSLTINVQ